MRPALAVLALVLGTASWAQAPDAGTPASDAGTAANATLVQCAGPLPAPRMPLSFGPGEVLEYDVDAIGAQAGKMTLRVQRPKDGVLPIQFEAKTNTFFNKVRKVEATATSSLNPRTLRPDRYYEDATENDVNRVAEVMFDHKTRKVRLDSTANRATTTWNFNYDKEGLDVLGAMYLVRQIPLKEGLPICFDVYGVRKLWRLSGTVVRREHVSSPLGEFEAWYLSGVAMRIDYPATRREIHLWISDDAQRLPLAAIGAIDLGTVRATLTAVTRPGDKDRVGASGKKQLKW